MNNKLSIRATESSLAPATMPQGMAIRGLQDVITIGGILSKSGFFKDAKTESQAVAKIMRGWELGIPPVAALETVYVIEGKTGLAAHMIAALIKRSGRYNYRVKENTAEACTILFLEQGEGIGEANFTIKDAQAAGLANKDVWKKYPKAMLYARCISQGAKMFCPDVFGGSIYTPDELGADVDQDGNVINIPATTIAAPSLEPTNVNGEVIKSVCNVLSLEVKDVYSEATAALGLQGKKSRELTSDECFSVVKTIMLAWGIKQGVFSHTNHAQNALNKLLSNFDGAIDYEEMAIAWKNDVESRMDAHDEPDTIEVGVEGNF